MEGKIKSFLNLLYFLPLLAVLAFGIFKNADAPINDFANYYFGGYFQYKGELPTLLYQPFKFNQEIEKEGFLKIFSSFSPNPPSLAFLFQPFILFAPSQSKLIFNILGSLFFIGFCFRWQRFFSIDFRLAVLIPILFYKPIMANLNQGQLYFFLVIFILEGFIALKKQKFLLFSVLWSVAVFLKIFPIILGLYLLSTRQLKAALWFGFVLIFSFGGLVLLQGASIWSTFIFDVLPEVSNGSVIDSYAVSFQSWPILFSYLFCEDSIRNPNPLIDSILLFSVSLVLIKTLLIGQSVALANKNQHTYTAFGIFILAGMLLTPTGSVYSLILLICIFPGLFEKSLHLKTNNILGVQPLIGISVLVFFICNVSFHTNENLPFFFKFSRLFILLVSWLIIFKKTDFQWVYSLVAFLLFSPPLVKMMYCADKKDPSSYFPVQQNRGIVSRFVFDGQSFKYWYRDESGQHQKIKPYTTQSIDSQSVYVSNNCLFKGKILILNSPDQKENPVLINGKTIVYMSTKHKGPGFFSFRQIDLDASN